MFRGHEGGRGRGEWRGFRGGNRGGTRGGRGGHEGRAGPLQRGNNRAMNAVGDTGNGPPAAGNAGARGNGTNGRGRFHNGRGGFGRGRGRGDAGNERTTFPIGREKLQKLADAPSDSDLLEGLTMDGSFYALLNSEHKPDFDRRLLVLAVLARASQFNVAHFRITLHGLLRRVVESKFLQDWLSKDFVDIRLRLGQVALATENVKKQFAEYACIILLEILDKLPDSAMQIREITTMVLDAIKDKNVFNDADGGDGEDEPRYRRAQIRLEDLWNDFVERKQKQPETDVEQSRRGRFDRAPLDDFRELPILPQETEILTDEKPRLRSNIVRGAYESVDHYLDVQFRLLREDFIGPIREAIGTITEEQEPEMVRQAKQGRQHNKISIYRRAVFSEPQFEKHSTAMLYHVQFDVGQFRRVNWETSRRMLQGSLLCFSSDEFRTMFFATIFNWNPNELSKGIVQVTVDHFPPGGLDKNRAYSFVESPSFFEAYKHVLLALQNIRGGDQDMPFVRHLVFCEPVVRPPVYLEDNGTVDFSSLLVERRDRGRGELVVNDVLRQADWPTKEQIGLDESQFNAFRQALTKRVAIIQGPPGTGKTYVGLKIVQVLLNKLRGTGPMLVVCFTNHALDQFLEGIASFLPDGGEGSVVRIGGSAKMKEEMKRFQLKCFLENRRDWDNGPVRHQIYELNQERKAVGRNIEAMKELGKVRRGWMLTAEQIERVTNGRSEETLFSARYQQPQENLISKEATLPVWLQQIAPLGQRPPSNNEILAVWRLKSMCFFSMATCFKAVRLTGSSRDDLAFLWLSNVDELMMAGYSEFEACFAMELNNNDVEQAYAWLLGANGRPQQHQQQQQVVAVGGAEPNDRADAMGAAGEEAIGIWEEALDPDRDFVDANEEWDEEMAEEMFGGFRGGFNNNTDAHIFVKVGKAPALPQFILTCIETVQPMTAAEAERALENPWQLPVPERWRLYRYWRQRWFEMALEAQRDWEQQYQRLTERLRELQDLSLVHDLRATAVIGMTTTGAAKKQAVLQQLKPKVVVIEEAAEVLEAHIVTSLSSGCEHLILIGDHKQLRPKPSVYELARNFNFDISLFERLINNNFTYAMLNEQHRMRPEIADVLMPQFYDGLLNHVSVFNRDHIRGLARDMFFVDHRHYEEQTGDSTSHKNMHEARFLVAHCKYLLQQGYQADQITILCCYLAQMFEIKRQIVVDLMETERPRVAVVDNFQGEENDIILLSMVRSNRDGRVGFLNMDNRVCVALSRAKIGFYIIGNFKHLADNSELWARLVNVIGVDNLGSELELRCQIHDTSRRITNAEDFVKMAPDGGCAEMCDTRMPCGHVCNRRCHPIDARHENVRCTRECEKLCPQGHKCPRRCYQQCGDCNTRVEKKLPCGHTITARCHESAEDIFCTQECDKILDGCGHRCQQRCGDKCNGANCLVAVVKSLQCGHTANLPCKQNLADHPCKEKVTKKMPFCDHEIEMACFKDVFSTRCPQPCGAVLECEDPCTGTCGECRRGRLHKKCEADCKRILICGHECKEKCSKACPPCPMACENRCVHSRCGQPKRAKGQRKASGRKCGEPCPPCVEKCAWSCEHHTCDLPCYEPCKRKRCMEKCKKLKKCGHECIGVCGELCPKICRQCNQEEFEEVLEQQNQLMPVDEEQLQSVMFVQLEDCGHLFEVNFLDQWFDEKIKQMEERTEAMEIQLLQCLWCKTPVRTTQRYGAVAKQCLLDVQKVKTKEHGDRRELQRQRENLERRLKRFVDRHDVSGAAGRAKEVLMDLITKPDADHLSRDRLTNLTSMVAVLEQMVQFSNETEFTRPTRVPISRFSISDRITPISHSTTAKRFIKRYYPAREQADAEANSMELVHVINGEVIFLFKWISDNAKSPSAQMMQELALEWRRTTVLARLVEFIITVTNKGKELNEEHWTTVDRIMGVLHGCDPIRVNVDKTAIDLIKQLAIAYSCSSGLGITDQERVEIVKAVGLSRGHWFKCPNGHIYCIGECGGAMQEAKCPECDARIGGGSHRLLADNAVASEMDGARQSSYEMDVLNDAEFARQLQMQLEQFDGFFGVQ